MGKRKVTPEEALIESFDMAKENHPFFRTLSNEAYCGYVTAIVKSQYNNLEISTSGLFEVAKKLIEQGKL